MPLMFWFALTSIASVTSMPLAWIDRITHPAGPGPNPEPSASRVEPGYASSSKLKSSPTRVGGTKTVDDAPELTGRALTVRSFGSDDAAAGSTTMRPRRVDGFMAARRTSSTSASITVTVVTASSGTSSLVIIVRCARSVYEPGATPLSANAPSDWIGALSSPAALGLTSGWLTMIIPELRGVPSDAVTVPVTRQA